MSEFKVGDLVTVKGESASAAVAGVVFKVQKVNPKNVLAHPVVRTATPGGKGINYPAELLDKFEGEVPKHGRVAVIVPLPEFYDIGEIVTFKRPPTGATTTTPYVVIKDGGDKVNVTKLGGEGSRYYRAPKAGVVKRDLAWLKENFQP